MLEIYAIAGGDWLRGNLNAIAAFMGTSTWSTIEKMCIAISVLIVAGNWVKKHNVMDLIGWVFSLTLVSMLVVIRTPVQIIDYSNVAQVYEVDNVPIGLAIPASLTTRVGNALIQSYEMVFALPDSVTYSKTGMLFGSNLVAKSTDFLSQNPQITTLFSDYVQNCVMGDIFLNHKYSFEELLNSPDPYTLIFANPSPLRGVFDKNNQFQTCEEASRDLKSALALDTQTGGKTWNYYVRQLFGGKPNPDLLFSQMIGDSYNYFYSSGQSAGQIIRQNVTMNALRSGIQSYAARSGDTASLVNMANTSSLEKQRLAQATMGHQALRTLPLMQTVIMGIMIGMFPIMVMAAMFNMMTLQVLKGYVFALIWLQTWPLLFAILNSAMAYYAKQNGVPVVLSELSQVQLKNSDIATTAGYIAVMIPPLSWGIVKSMGAAFSSAYSHFSSSGLSATSQAASGVVDGNYSFANMQMENVSGYSWGTNSTTSFGQMSRQLANGGISTQTRDGSMVWDSSGAMSKLPVDINVGRQIASAQQQMAREADVQAESALHGYNSSVTSAWNSLQQFGTNKGNSASTTTGADTTESSQDSMARSKMWNAVVANAKANNISNEESFQQLMDDSAKSTQGVDLYGSGKWSSGDQLFGKLGKWGTGLSAEAGVKGSAGWTHSSGNTDNVGTSGRESNDSRHDTSSQAAKDFKEASDYFTSRKTTTSGNITDNNASSRVDQFAASLSSAKNSYDQYTSSRTRSHEYSEMASRTESMTGQMNENLTQQFANFVQHRAPQDAEAILTNTSSPEIAAQREALAREFVKEQVEPRVDAAYQQGRESIGQNMAGVSGGGDNGSVMADYRQNSGRIDAMTQDAGIKDNVDQKVGGMITENKQQQQETRENIQRQGAEVKNENTEMEKDHKTKANKFKGDYNERKSKVKSLPGADSPTELEAKAAKIQKDYLDGKR
ncbi:TPA: conjugal transfer mating pair stabilization protein TraG [Klebsiella pneumoniae]|jgi:conjugal transfer mating pair stabilization protein TraG|uniref:conjugal transfer mating-pair stabilization protein TraG n=1 Tax=Klebsiella pneumoniae TaxID=573 RepID=UPI00124C6BB6|nr:conjugal transfer mating-pair stabilization protein TraG [Klebsiella pneumoniae]MCX2313413.1 conjugal transfer mating pair stabilization protein TraG [Klebsiella pneumoniae]MCX2581461.1 conjugal transfer mating pair stabilization protein TraG [Klebsiella pneumoniae]MEC4428830.1 conjugal transfer mating-pair stabilization protein TraG [Klebsiella pneumoniae]MEC4439202.1 conjugal transfer mating-pair stabilization protein TraG [Klebsiella pneumoniae]MEC4474874.1 conjugal transfer mating-pair 